MYIYAKRTFEILTIIALLFIRYTLTLLIVYTAIFLLLFYREQKSFLLSLDVIGFTLTYLVMLITHFYFPGFNVIGHMPHFIYPILSAIALFSLIIKQPFTRGISFNRKRHIPSYEFIRSLLWLFCFLAATLSSFLFFPHPQYLILSTGFIILAILLNIMVTLAIDRTR